MWVRERGDGRAVLASDRVNGRRQDEGDRRQKRIFRQGQSLKEMGTKDMDVVQLNQLIGQKTGGISVYPFTSSLQGWKDPISHMIVRGKAMSTRSEDLFNLMNRIIDYFQLTDQNRFKQFVSQSKEMMENRLRGSGHGIAASRMDAKLNIAGSISEQMGV